MGFSLVVILESALTEKMFQNLHQCSGCSSVQNPSFIIKMTKGVILKGSSQKTSSKQM